VSLSVDISILGPENKFDWVEGGQGTWSRSGSGVKQFQGIGKRKFGTGWTGTGSIVGIEPVPGTGTGFHRGYVCMYRLLD